MRDDLRGAVAVEFGICITAFIALLLGCLQVALLFFAQQSIQTASETVARSVLTGNVATSTTQEQFRKSACSALPSYMDCAKLMVDIRKAPSGSFSSVDTSVMALTYDSKGNVTNSWKYDMGGAGDVVILRLMYPWQTVTGPLNMSLSNQGSPTRLLMGTMVFKSEPYSQ